MLLANPVAADTTVNLTVTDATGQTTRVVGPRPAGAAVHQRPDVLAERRRLRRAISARRRPAPRASGALGTRRRTAGRPPDPLRRRLRPDRHSSQATRRSRRCRRSRSSTDNAGVAQVGVQALPNSTTQPAQLRATDVTTGQCADRQLHGRATTPNATQSPIVVVPEQREHHGRRTTRRARPAFRRRLLHLRRHAAVHACSRRSRRRSALLNIDRRAERRLLQRGHQRHLRESAGLHDLDAAGKQTTASLINSPGTPDTGGGGGGGGGGTLVVTPHDAGRRHGFVREHVHDQRSVAVRPRTTSRKPRPLSPLASFPSSLAAPGTASFSGLGGTSGTVVVYTFNVHDGFSPANNMPVTITCLVP